MPRTLPAYLMTPQAKRFALGAAVFAAYVVSARLGLSIHALSGFATLFWPPSGIALAALLLYDLKLARWVAFAAFIVNYSIGAPPLVALAMAFGNTLEALVGAWLLTRYLDFRHSLFRVRDSFNLVLTAALAPLIAATVGTVALFLGDHLSLDATPLTWLAWWSGDALGIVLLTPFLLKWLSRPIVKRTRIDLLELLAAVSVVAGISVILFWLPGTRFVFLSFIPLGWVALRSGPRGTTLGVLLFTLVALVGTVFDLGPYATFASPERYFFLEVLLGTVACFFLVFSSVVEERRQAGVSLERNIAQLERALRRASSEDEAKNEFIAILAHELRNPLAAILSSAELLKVQGGQNMEGTGLLNIIDDRVRATARLLDDLLDISRISQKKFRLQKKTVALAPIIEQAIHTAAIFMNPRGQDFSVDMPERDLFLDADPVRLGQIIANLLNNASKYTEEGGTISLVAETHGKELLLRVRDSGIGIPSHMLQRIFEPFFQIERGKRSAEGLGIGLALTRDLVEMHGGSIEAKSRGEGYGSEFIVRLSLHADATAPSENRSTLQGERTLRRAKQSLAIVVVDDNVPAADALQRLLTLRGHEVAVAYTGEGALQALRQHRPRVAIVDIGLPDIDGYEVARRAKKAHPGTFLIALTGYGQLQDKSKALEAGFDHHLTKPVGLKDLEIVLRKAVQA